MNAYDAKKEIRLEAEGGIVQEHAKLRAESGWSYSGWLKIVGEEPHLV